MIFSVFDPQRRTFDYFEAPGTAINYGARGTKYRPLHGAPQGPSSGGLGGAGSRIGPIGFAPEALGVRLPSEARRVGTGDIARGVVAVRGGGREMGTYGGLGSYHEQDGLGATPIPVQVTVNSDGTVSNVTTLTYPFGQVVAAACLAAIVGVVVQKVLKSW